MTPGCHAFREHLSADLDRESGPESVPGREDSLARRTEVLAEAYRHLDECTDCSIWFASVTRINRWVALGPADPGPGLSEDQLRDVLEHLPRRRRVTGRGVVRSALALVGAAQTTLGALPLLHAFVAGAPMMMGGGMAQMMAGGGMAHMSHEFAAWNLALGVCFLVGAARTRHLVGTLPVLASFVAVLSTMSAVDLLRGAVEPSRILSHSLVLAGTALIIVLVVQDLPHPWRRLTQLRRRRGQATDTESFAAPEAPKRWPTQRHGRGSGPAARRDVA
jgi:predicted anti-sigma-YlaC factor YlaD